MVIPLHFMVNLDQYWNNLQISIYSLKSEHLQLINKQGSILNLYFSPKFNTYSHCNDLYILKSLFYIILPYYFHFQFSLLVFPLHIFLNYFHLDNKLLQNQWIILVLYCFPMEKYWIIQFMKAANYNEQLNFHDLLILNFQKSKVLNYHH